MGLTIVGMGNSSVDFFVDCQLAKDGYEIMALSGLIGGQMFNFLLGIGLSQITRFCLDTN